EKTPSRGARAVAAYIRESVEPGSQLMTDEYSGYEAVGKDYDHSKVAHSKLQFVEGLTHTNSIENSWSLFKRGLVGSFHKISEKHLDRYLDEFTYRRSEEHTSELQSRGHLVC